MLRLIAWISLIVGPVLLLVLFQLQFLPYHVEMVSWWQRIAVVIDLVLLWMLWPLIARGTNTWLRWRDFLRVRIAGLVLLSFLPVLLVYRRNLSRRVACTSICRLCVVPTSWSTLIGTGRIGLIAPKSAYPMGATNRHRRTSFSWAEKLMTIAQRQTQLVVEPAGGAGDRSSGTPEIRHEREDRESPDDIVAAETAA